MMIDEEEARRRAKEAYRLGCEEAKVLAYDDLRNLAGQFALEVYHLRRELRHALGLPPLPDDDGDRCDRGPLQ